LLLPKLLSDVYLPPMGVAFCPEWSVS